MVCLTNPPFWTFRLFLFFSIIKYATVVTSVENMWRQQLLFIWSEHLSRGRIAGSQDRYTLKTFPYFFSNFPSERWFCLDSYQWCKLKNAGAYVLNPCPHWECHSFFAIFLSLSFCHFYRQNMYFVLIISFDY